MAENVQSTAVFGADNRVIRSDGTDRLVQDSAVTLDDSGVFSGIVSIEGGLVINELGADVDLRVEGDTADQLLVVDAGLDAVQIGTGAAGAIADFRSSGVVFNEFGADRDTRFEADANANLLILDAGVDSGVGAVQVGASAAGDLANFKVSGININSGEYDTDFNLYGTLGSGSPVFTCDAGLRAILIDSGNAASFGASSVVLNENGADRDFRVEGDSNPYMIFVDATSTTENIALVTSAAPNWQSMDQGLFLGNVSTAPTGNPSSGVFVYSNGSNNGVLTTRDAAGVTKSLVKAPDIQVFTASGTWTKPAGAVTVIRHVIGGGGGGGSGRRDDTDVTRAGGGGGGGGGYATDSNDAVKFGSTETVTVGGGGSPGATRTADDTEGQAGTAGGNSSMTATGTGGSTLTANGGGGGGGGTSTGGTGGSGGSGATANGAAGGAGADTTNFATVGSAVTGRMAGAGGGGGGAISSANAVSFSAAGGSSSGVGGPRGLEQNLTGAALVGFAGDNGAGGLAYVAGNTPYEFGGGGGGGGGTAQGSTSGSHLGFGGTGGLYGGGGGGGAGVLNGSTIFNAGGAGRGGVVVVVTLFE